MPFRFEIVRSGEFRCPAAARPGKCGPLQAQSFRYEVRLRANTLNRQKFVIDTLEIDKYFATRYLRRGAQSQPISCESIAIQALKDFAQILRNDGRVLTHGVCKIWGFYPQSYVEVSFDV